MKSLSLLFFFFGLLLLTIQGRSDKERREALRRKVVRRVAFASCNDHKRNDTNVFEVVKETKPDIFIWHGDVVYADKKTKVPFFRAEATPDDLRHAYRMLKNNRYYQSLISWFILKHYKITCQIFFIFENKGDKNLEIFGTYDDHDYGK